MRPVNRKTHNFTYAGPTPEIGDLSCERRDGGVFSHWRPSEEELRILNAGGEVELGVYVEPIPPVSLNVVPAEPSPKPGPPQPPDEGKPVRHG